jgi:type VI secretion system protein ImpK
MTGLNPLNASAATLFALVSRIRNRAQHADPDALRRSVVAEIRAFENRALQAGIEDRQVKVARYAICATIDDVVLNTPWGSDSVWAQQSMVATFHRETVGGDRFYDLLARLEQSPANNIDLLEFLYMCLSLGFEGRLRVEPGGQEKHQNIRAGLAKLIRAHRGQLEHDLSPLWKGIDKPYKPLSIFKPIWIAVACVAALLATGFIGLSYALSTGSSRVAGQLAAIDSGFVPVLDRPAPPVIPPPPPENGELERVTGFLEEEIAEGIVSVFQSANTIVIRLSGSGMFASASDVLEEAFEVPLTRVAAALDDVDGPVIVAGHSDSQPIRSARFPNNLALSLARAEAVAERVGSKIADPTRLSAEGRADREPIAPNDTAEGRATNRRIEIVLVQKDGQ